MAQTMGRRKFLSLAASSVAVGAILALQGCSSGSSTSTTPTPSATDKVGAISSNHGHSVTLTAAQQQAGVAVTLATSGGTHKHTLSLTAENVVAAAAGTKVSQETSTTNGHSHMVTFN